VRSALAPILAAEGLRCTRAPVAQWIEQRFPQPHGAVASRGIGVFVRDSGAPVPRVSLPRVLADAALRPIRNDAWAKVGQKFSIDVWPVQSKGPVSAKGPVSGAFRVAGAGFEPATSGLCAWKSTAFPSRRRSRGPSPVAPPLPHLTCRHDLPIRCDCCRPYDANLGSRHLEHSYACAAS
jgi:hypothetical protein